MLQERPQLAIKVCGVAVQADRNFYVELDKQQKKDTKQAPDSAAVDYTQRGARPDAGQDSIDMHWRFIQRREGGFSCDPGKVERVSGFAGGLELGDGRLG